MSRQVPVHADALMGAVINIEEFFVELHSFDWFSCDSILLEVTLESLEAATLGPAPGVYAKHRGFTYRAGGRDRQ